MEKRLTVCAIIVIALFLSTSLVFSVQTACACLEIIAIAIVVIGILAIMRAAILEMVTGKRIR